MRGQRLYPLDLGSGGHCWYSNGFGNQAGGTEKQKEETNKKKHGDTRSGGEREGGREKVTMSSREGFYFQGERDLNKFIDVTGGSMKR